MNQLSKYHPEMTQAQKNTNDESKLRAYLGVDVSLDSAGPEVREVDRHLAGVGRVVRDENGASLRDVGAGQRRSGLHRQCASREARH